MFLYHLYDYALFVYNFWCVILQWVSSVCQIESTDNSCDGSKLEDVGEEATTLQEETKLYF
jgi:hypothetical protein